MQTRRLDLAHCVADVVGRDDVITAEHACRLVSCNLHGAVFTNACITEILDRTSTQVMEVQT